MGIALFLPSAAFAHATGESYVWLNVEESGVEGRFEIRLIDLRERLGVEIPEAGGGRLDAVLATAPEVQAYLKEHFEIRAGGRELAYEFLRTEVEEVEGLGAFGKYFYRVVDANVPDQLEIHNRILTGDDRFHRSLLCIEYDRRSGKNYGEEFTALVFSAANPEQTLDLSDVQSLLRVRDFVWQGILHIWIGIDHVLFLVALLLTAVLARRREGEGLASVGERQPVASFRAAFWNIVKIVTVFTVAHSITLSLAALGFVNLSSRLVESIIAFSIVLVAINNVWPKVPHGSSLLIFFFGLFHGMGFASVMGELPFRMMHLVQVILAFNVGVELGQVAIVAVVFPILFALRKSAIYRPVFLLGGSIVIGLMASYWFIERAFGL